MFKTKLHRKVEKSLGLKKNSLQIAFRDLKEKHQYTDLMVAEAARSCAEYCKFYGNNEKDDFVTAFNLFVSCLNNPKKLEQTETGGVQ